MEQAPANNITGDFTLGGKHLRRIRPRASALLFLFGRCSSRTSFEAGKKSQRAHLASSACAMSSGSRVIFSRVQLFVCD
jgi:hypothetical protein